MGSGEGEEEGDGDGGGEGEIVGTGDEVPEDEELGTAFRTGTAGSSLSPARFLPFGTGFGRGCSVPLKGPQTAVGGFPCSTLPNRCRASLLRAATTTEQRGHFFLCLPSAQSCSS